MVRHQEGGRRRAHHLLAHQEPDQGRRQGLQVQDALRICSLSHQHRHLREGRPRRDPQLLGRASHPTRQHVPGSQLLHVEGEGRDHRRGQ